MAVKIKYLGALRHASGSETIILNCKEGSSILDLVNVATAQSPTLRRNILDEQLDPPTPNALILINGKEISVLDGLNTKLSDGDEVVFVPVVHGG